MPTGGNHINGRGFTAPDMNFVIENSTKSLDFNLVTIAIFIEP
jgi:hypothetical protein